MDIGLSTIWPVRFCADGLRCFLTTLTPSMVTRSFFGNACAIVPEAPRFLPAMTITLSPFFSFIWLYDFRRQCDDFLISPFNNLARNRTKHAIRFRLFLFLLHQNNSVLVKTNVRTILPAKGLFLADDHGAIYFFFLHRLPFAS